MKIVHIRKDFFRDNSYFEKSYLKIDTAKTFFDLFFLIFLVKKPAVRKCNHIEISVLMRAGGKRVVNMQVIYYIRGIVDVSCSTDHESGKVDRILRSEKVKKQA